MLISISSLAHRAKAVGVHKCSGAGGGTVFGMFLLETGIIIFCALLLMAVLLLNFRDFVEDTTAAKLSMLFAPERIWVPVSVVAVLFVVGGMLPGRLFAGIPVSQVFHRYTESKKGWKRPLLSIQFAGVAFICGLMCVVMMQYRYVLDKDMGYNPKNLAVGELYMDDEASRDAAYQSSRVCHTWRRRAVPTLRLSMVTAGTLSMTMPAIRSFPPVSPIICLKIIRH